jgi:hypothetical protein
MAQIVEKMEIPEDVVNPKAYRAWLGLKRHPILQNIVYTTSEGEVYKITTLDHRLRAQIAHLSLKEQDTILELKAKYNRILGKLSSLHAVAYGRAGRNGGRRKEDIVREKLTPFEEDIATLLGRMFTIPEVVKIMHEDNGIDVTETDVKYVLKKYITTIEKSREEFRRKVTDVRLYNKRPRLEELAWMYSRMKNRYIALNGIEAYNAMLRTLEQIRKEAEGDVININGVLDVNVEAQIQEHIQQEIYKTINIKEIILSRVAARMQYDPMKLIAGLHNSYYAKFVDISGDLDEDAEMHYPSNEAYDFTKIEREAEKVTLDMSAAEVTKEEKSNAVNIRELFLSKIKEQKRNLESKNVILDSLPTEDVDYEEYYEENQGRKRGRPTGKHSRETDKHLPSRSAKGEKKLKKVGYYSGKKFKK